MTAVGWARSEHPVAEAFAAMGAALDGVAEVALWSSPDGRVEELLAQAHRLEGRLVEMSARLVAEVERRQVAKLQGGASTGAWLRRRLQLAPTDAKQRMTLAAGLCRLELARQAMAAGDISPAHARVIVRVMDTLPSGLGSETLETAERQLIAWSGEFDPTEVARLGRRLWEVIDPDGADEREARLLERQEPAASGTCRLARMGSARI